MISRVRGILEDLTEAGALITVGGFTYEVLLTSFTMDELFPLTGKEITLYTHLFVQGGVGGGPLVPTLIGFRREMERDFFARFTSVEGIGPRAGLKALRLPVETVAAAIEQGDKNTLSSLPGIGKQRAGQIIAKLQGKVKEYAGEVPPERVEALPVPQADWTQEALEVLLQLGHRRGEGERMIQEALNRNPDIQGVEALIQEVYRMQAQR